MDRKEREMIMEAIAEINADNSIDPTEKERVFSKKFPKFHERYPVLFAMACKENLTESQNLKYMLEMMQKMNNGMTQEKASEHVGQSLFNQYVAPKIEPHNK
jgi:hypothetical protein